MKQVFFTKFYNTNEKLNDIIADLRQWIKNVYLKREGKHFVLKGYNIIYIPHIEKIRFDAIIQIKEDK